MRTLKTNKQIHNCSCNCESIQQSMCSGGYRSSGVKDFNPILHWWASIFCEEGSSGLLLSTQVSEKEENVILEGSKAFVLRPMI